jgi:hypothetical protein
VASVDAGRLRGSSSMVPPAAAKHLTGGYSCW